MWDMGLVDPGYIVSSDKASTGMYLRVKMWLQAAFSLRGYVVQICNSLLTPGQFMVYMYSQHPFYDEYSHELR